MWHSRAWCAGWMAGIFLSLAAIMPVSAQAQAKPDTGPVRLLVMCGDVAAASPANAHTIRTADDALVALALANAQLSNIYRAFLASCPAFLHHEPDSSPGMAYFRDRVMDLSLTHGYAEDTATALRNLLKTPPVASLARQSGKTGEAAYCAFTITTTSAELLQTADALTKRAQVDCGSAGK